MTVYNTSNRASATFGIGGGTTSYDTIGDLPLVDNSTGDTAFVTANNKLYIWNGAGWYAIATVNETPTWDSGGSPESTYAVPNDGSSLTITLAASDPEGFAITYTAVTDSEFDAFAEITQNSDESFTVTKLSSATENATGTVTFRASDGVNILSGISTFSIAFSVQNSKYTSALITSVGSNGAVNTGLTDKNTTPKTLTVSGAVAQTFSPYNAGGYSTYFSATNLRNYTTTDSSDFYIGTNDFSYEAWVWADPSANFESYSRAFGLGPYYNNTASFGLILSDFDNSNNITMYWNNGSMVRGLVSSQAMEKGKWVHLVVCRESNNTAIFYNGTRIASGTESASIGANTYAFLGHTGNGSEGFKGYIYDARFINGSSAYDPTSTSITVPTEKLTATADTKLLAARLPYPKDESASDHSWTVGATFKPFNVFDTGEYDSATHGASLYTASGQYITVADTDDLDMGTGDFTVEFWHYNVSTPGNYPSIVSGESWSNPSGGVAIRFNNTTAPNKVTFFWNGIGDPWLTSSSSFRANEWMHIALTRSGNNFSLWVNGKQEATGSNTGSIDWCKGGDFHIHWGEWDGANGYVNGFTTDLRILKGTALYTAAFTPPTEPLQEITNTVLLVNGHDDAAIIDKAQSGHLALNGNIQSSTTQTKHSSSSMYFDGSGDYITFPHVPEYDLNTGDFTIEAWVYQTADGVTAANETYSPIISLGNFFSANSSSRVSWDFKYNQQQGNKLNLSHKPTNNFDSTFKSSYSNAINMGTGGWHHVAVTRESGTIKFWYDGTNVGSDASTFNGVNLDVSIPANDNLYLGRMSGGTSLDQYTWHFTGYIEDARVTKGLARYTANFTPPTASLEG